MTEPEPAAELEALAELRARVREAQRAAERLAASSGPGRAGAQRAGDSGGAPADSSGGAPAGSSGGAPADSSGGAPAGSSGTPAGDTPAGGWESEATAAGSELRALADLLETLRTLLPQDLREQLAELTRQLLLVLRAIIDWLVGRLEHGEAPERPPVQDIPIT